ncbi:dethiobiotin synthase [Candidatus Ruthia magnifica str. Cm (Calyptogena magnifica)]|uniref:ATP-dependent dethiobiotin synthetase BioD n=1 Tax=Ruthia magnifica subsp. Calyptogena magnifica TaxID=413404 RepID=BIOD_RUTMC|nr:dethiobiotin synthase [Candidatus Ruthturnera calyptogenae]A1AV54.1 RecName: Full=ATP-dependent dethiobiotin synthetase BioD; AltName: Full=DTB synthetase; Short=DTBS; AltName: Full=Dethiobiotin synthase [Candidatus Ruthia magnifica str. Cm (Calyptogena magnifica)]ABL01811.1 dethiobiotin synthase [Candidatus Ruthia magnifica str. Cm (Calyptogena magnifica)]
MKGLFISGSGTNVGKTFVAQYLIRLLSNTLKVSARKPVESDCENKNGRLIPKDALLLSKACNINEPIDKVCRYKLESCSSAQMASQDSGLKLTLDDLVDACMSDEFVIVEGTGGLLSPIARQALNSDLIQALDMPVVLVIKDELGAVNQALLSINSAQSCGLSISMLVLNQIQPNFLKNAQAIKQHTDIDINVFNQNHLASFERKVKKILLVI